MSYDLVARNMHANDHSQSIDIRRFGVSLCQLWLGLIDSVTRALREEDTVFMEGDALVAYEDV